MVRETKTEKVLILKPFGKFLSYSGMKFKIKNKGHQSHNQSDPDKEHQ